MKIEDHALIGDCQTAALVGRNGSIDWLCWPAFSHVALVNSAMNLCDGVKPAEQRAEKELA